MEYFGDKALIPIDQRPSVLHILRKSLGVKAILFNLHG